VSQLRLLAAAALFVAGAVAYADHPRHHRVPPQEAIAACASAKSGDACTFTLPARDGSGSGHTITGTSSTPPERTGETTTLACKPDHPPPHGDRDGPPPPPPGD
jgi:hypothetical protein